MSMAQELTFYEFFAGGGMARLGLGPDWKCSFANDWCEKKAASYRAYFDGGRELAVEDVKKIKTTDMPGTPTLVWASFPCQDLSLAGSGAGLRGERSGTFTPFWNLMTHLIREGRKPSLVVLENVVGTITSHRGKDFETILRKVSAEGYIVGALVIDAVLFLPQSRPRLFLVAVSDSLAIPPQFVSVWPDPLWHPRSLIAARFKLPDSLQRNWVWWRLPHPPEMTTTLSSLIEDEPIGAKWHEPKETKRLLSLMSDLNLEKVKQAQKAGERKVGTVYRRTRPTPSNGNDVVKVQRAEVRFDEISGCLRTPAGGSSRQIILVVEGSTVRSRLISPREVARLMGVPESYPIPANYNEAYHLFGDGVVVPVVAWLNRHVLLPIAQIQMTERPNATTSRSDSVPCYSVSAV